MLLCSLLVIVTRVSEANILLRGNWPFEHVCSGGQFHLYVCRVGVKKKQTELYLFLTLFDQEALLDLNLSVNWDLLGKLIWLCQTTQTDRRQNKGLGTSTQVFIRALNSSRETPKFVDAITREGGYVGVSNWYHRCFYYKSQTILSDFNLEVRVRGQFFWKSCEWDNSRRKSARIFKHTIHASTEKLRRSTGGRQYFSFMFTSESSTKSLVLHKGKDQKIQADPLRLLPCVTIIN